jgi:hypothetical protein
MERYALRQKYFAWENAHTCTQRNTCPGMKDSSPMAQYANVPIEAQRRSLYNGIRIIKKDV